MNAAKQAMRRVPDWWPDVGLVLVKHLKDERYVSRRVIDISRMPRKVHRYDGSVVTVADDIVTYSTGGNSVRRVRAASWREWQKGAVPFSEWERRKADVHRIVEEPEESEG